MPGMNGIELALKFRGLRPDIIIVFLSAYERYLRESNEIGVDYYILKPYKREDLEMVMERVRGRPAGRLSDYMGRQTLYKQPCRYLPQNHKATNKRT